MNKSVGFFELGNTYAGSAGVLSEAVSLGTFKATHTNHPIDFLYAHGLELMLKGCLLDDDPEKDVGAFGHNLLGLYEEVKKTQLLGGLINSVEQALRTRWKQHLRDARDSHEDILGLGSLSPSQSEEFGIFGNDVIGSQLPELRDQVLWLSDRHSVGGGQFRYLKCGLDQRPYINAFGLSDDVVWLSSEWACEEIYRRFRKQYSTKQFLPIG